MILVAVVLGAVVPGCDRAPRYDGRLTAADSLMHDNPDSALAVLESLTADSLASQSDRPYRDLLVTQARYKAYITATSDSDINRALAYFSDHPADREKLTRAYIYKGAVMDELGHPDSAMLYYKTAESTAAPYDYFNLGYCNLRIAELYQSDYCNDSAVLSRMRKANCYFKAIGDTNYLITTIGSQGLFLYKTDMEAAKVHLNNAIDLAAAINSPKRFVYQSKLAGIHFYKQDYQSAKDLALYIILNGEGFCDENQYFYYAARSYIKLNLIDSARWIESIIPSPLEAVDSMNNYLLLADFAQAEHQYREQAYYIHQADIILNRLTKTSINSRLALKELSFDANQREKEMTSDFNSIMTRSIYIFLLVIAVIITVGIVVIKIKVRGYQHELEHAQNDLEELMASTQKKIAELEIVHVEERENLERKLALKYMELDELTKMQSNLEIKHSDIAKQVSFIIRHRNDALRELYNGFRVKSETRNTRSVIPLVGLIKDLNEKKRLLHPELNETFWTNLKLSVDGEYQGIASFVEKKYPFLSNKERHLFLLLCAGLPNQIIKMCMGYYSDATVSNNKRRLIQEKFGMNVKFEDFLDLYLQGKLCEEES